MGAIAAGNAHTCVIVPAGQVTCWGDDSAGQLGNGAVTGAINSPPSTITLPAGSFATALTAGANHTCALLNVGQVSCWGDDSAGQLGNGVTTGNVVAPPAPIVLPAGATATAVAAGDNHTCALLINGDVTCWGSDNSGQLGNGAVLGAEAPPAPVTLPGGASATAVAAGADFTCALLTTGQVTCWGSDTFGQLGNDATTGNIDAPPAQIALPTGTTATAITAGGSHVCALLNVGRVACWGSDSAGQVGNGSTTGNVAAPTTITLPAGASATAVVAAATHTCALLSNGQVTCWGDDTAGQLGNADVVGNITAPPAVVTLPTGTTAIAVMAGGYHTCVLLNTYQFTCWGSNASGQLGFGITGGTWPYPPSPIVLSRGIPGGAVAVASGYRHTCAILTGGQVTCWGLDSDGQLGNGAASTGALASPPGPITLPGGATATAIAAGTWHSCALLNTGQISCWGSNFGQLGGGGSSGSVDSPQPPITLPGGATATAISAGTGHTCALLNTGQVTCWGDDSNGQLGNGAGGSALTPPSPVTLPSGTTAVSISAGQYHTCVVLNTGQVSCWGWNNTGQIGNGSVGGTVQVPSSPIAMPGGATATAVSAGYQHTCALLNTGQVTCWGDDSGGQLGNGAPTGTVSSPPSPIVLPAGATATAVVAPESFYSCALLNTGQVTCWGTDYQGVLGNGATTTTMTAPPAPVTLPGGASATAITAHYMNVCVLLATHQVSCWGDDNSSDNSSQSGQIGNGLPFGDEPAPVLAGTTPPLVVEPQVVNTPPWITVVAQDTTGLSTSTGAPVEDPVNTASGNLSDVHTDLAGEAFGLDLVRAYNGFDQTTSALGPRWRFSTGPTIEATGANYRVTLSDGSRFLFSADGGGGWITPDGLHATLTIDPATPVGGGSLPMLRVTHQDGSIDRFDTLGRLIEQLSWDGLTAASTYDTSGRLSTVTASTGQILTFSYDTSGKLATAALSTGRLVTYGYNVAGQFNAVTDEFGATTSMTYSSEGWLATVTDSSGILQMANTYDAIGRVVTQTSGSGGITTFTYTPADGTTLVHDSVTNTDVRYQHDTKGRVASITDPFGNAVGRAYDDHSNLVAGINRNGISAYATYDAHNNLTSTTEPGIGTTSYVYDTADRMTSTTDPWGATTTYGYELAERIPSTITNALTQTTTYDVVNGLVMSTTDADGVTVTDTYDTQRRLTAVKNEYNQSTIYEYNTRGQRTKITSPSGRTTTWTYDPTTTRLTSTTAPDGGVTAFTYDAAGRTLTITDPTGAVTTDTYDTAGRLATSTDPGSSTTTYVYDANDRLIKTVEPGGGELSNIYGPLGRVTSTKDQLNRTTALEYDSEGRQNKSTDPAGGVRQTLFDSSGRPFKTIDPQNRETVTEYDAHGRTASVTAPENLVTTYGYDVLGRTTTVTDPRTGVTTTTYTPGGRANTVTDPAGLITSYGYDLAGRQTSITAPGNLTTTFAYNPDSEVVTTTSPGGLITATTFDPAGRVATTTDPAGVATTNTWSLRGELLTSKKGAEGTTSYIYNPNTTMASATDALGRITTFGYDSRHNQTTRSAPNGAIDTWTYNAANQLLTAVDPLGRTTTYTYDDAGRAATITDPSGRVLTNTYNLDGTINTEAYTGGTTTTYAYDTAGRVSTMTDATGAYTFGYEPGGKLASTLTPAGRQTTWSHDNAGRRSAITYPDGASYQYSYDTAGRPWKITPSEVMADTFTASTGTVPDTGRWTTTVASSGTATVQSNALRLLWANTASSTASITSKAATAQDSEQVVRYQFATTTGTTVGKFIVKARNSTAGNIRVEFTSNSTTAAVFKQINTTSTQLGTFTTTVGTTPRWLRIKVTGTTVNVRSWADGTTEPATWNATLATATGVTTAGVPKLEITRTSGTNSVTIDNYQHTDPSTPQAPIETYGYNTDSQVTSETLAGGSRSRTYTLGRLTNFTETLPGLSVNTNRTYDTTGRVATETNGAVTTTYGYDAASQLKSATPSTGTATSWTYDQIGQRLTETAGATTTRYNYDIAGQLCWTTTGTMPPTPTCSAPPSGATTYTHDLAGRMLTETVTATNKVTYTYDPVGRLATAQRVNGATTTAQTRTYNPLQQLAGLTNTGGSTTTTTLDWDPTSRVAQLTDITTAGSSADLVAGPLGWVSMRAGGTNNSIGLDAYGSAVPTTATGSLARSTSYSAFGSAGGTNIFEPRLGYRGELTLDKLAYLRARNYQPDLARFTTTDPAPGRPGAPTLSNDYHYTGNMPLLRVDPLGLYGIDDSTSGGTGFPATAPVGGGSPSVPQIGEGNLTIPATATLTRFSIPVWKGYGVTRIQYFIDDDPVCLSGTGHDIACGHGDARGFAVGAAMSDYNLAARVRVVLDHETGTGLVIAYATHGAGGEIAALPVDMTIDGPVGLPDDYPSQFRLWTHGEGIDGNVAFDYRFVNSETPKLVAGAAPAINGAIRVRQGPKGAVRIDGRLAQYPSVEIIRDQQLPNGYKSSLIFVKAQESGGPLNLYEPGESFAVTG